MCITNYATYHMQSRIYIWKKLEIWTHQDLAFTTLGFSVLFSKHLHSEGCQQPKELCIHVSDCRTATRVCVCVCVYASVCNRDCV